MKERGKVTKIIAFFLLLPCVVISCQSQKDIDRDRRIFALQTKLLRLEKNFNKESEASHESGKSFSRGLVESQTLSEGIGREMQLIEGKIQTLEHFLGLDGLRPDEFASRAPDQKIAVLRSDLKHFYGRVEEIEKKLETLDKTQNDLFQNIESLLKAAASKKVASSSPTKRKERSQIASLSGVEKAFGEKRYTHVVEDYQALKAKLGKKSEYDLSYFYAASLFKLGRISDAALAFDDLLKTKTKSDKLPHVYLRLGDCFRLLGKKDVALIYYEELLEKYPKDSRAKIAKDYLKTLRKT